MEHCGPQIEEGFLDSIVNLVDDNIQFLVKPLVDKLKDVIPSGILQHLLAKNGPGGCHGQVTETIDQTVTATITVDATVSVVVTEKVSKKIDVTEKTKQSEKGKKG